MLEQEKEETTTQSARGSPEEEEDGEIVPDDSVVSGDITDPEFLQIMVSRMNIFFQQNKFREGDWMRTNLSMVRLRIRRGKRTRLFLN